jgi:sulfhydrogenase subunit alpha
MTSTEKEKSSKKSKLTRPINVDHIARIEGKAGIEVIYDGKDVEVVNVNVFEGPRYFEAITVGKPIEEAAAVFPRVCSFCAAAHKITAVEAIEDAIGLDPTEQTKKFRELLYIGDYLESHALHLFLLVLPDFLGYPDAFTMAKDYPDTVKAGMKMKDIGADIQTIIGSRYIHQENLLIGGFGSLPTKSKLLSLASRLKSLRNESEEALEHLVSYRNWPEVQATRNHLALQPRSKHYTMFGNEIHSTDGGKFKNDAYKMRISESVVPHSFAKHSHYNDSPFMTGALSRYTLFKDTLEGRAKELAGMYETYLDADNPMSNNFAQAIELVYYTQRAEVISRDLADSLKRYEQRIEPRVVSGTGVSVTEAPRGLLAYTIGVDKNGRVNKCDIITPTAMFLPIMEEDLQRMSQGLLNKGLKDTKEIGQKLETVVRSYDPCVSCSVHVTELK